MRAHDLAMKLLAMDDVDVVLFNDEMAQYYEPDTVQYVDNEDQDGLCIEIV